LGVYVDNFAGADPTGATDSTTAFVLALAALPTVTVHGTVTTPGKPGSAGSGTSATYPIGTIILGSGTYRIGTTSDIGNLGPFVSLIGPGHNACVLDYRGTGDALRAFNAVRPAGDTFFNLNGMSGRFDGLTIAGENAGAGAGGLHIGDGEGWILGADLDIRNFSGAESRGLWLDNNYSWTENITGSAAISNCTTLVEVSGGHGSTVQNGFTGGDNSFMYNKLSFKLYAFEQQNGIVFSNGAYFANGMLTIRANMKKNAATQTNALITLTGVCPAGHLGAGTYSQINTSHIDLTAEVNGSGVSSPMTVQYGDVVHNGIFGSYGLMAFSGGNAWTVSNWTLAGSFAVNNFNFQGIVYGDFNLKPGQGPGFTGAVYYGATTLFPDGGLAMDTGDYAAPCTLTSNLTVNMQNNRNGPQHKVITVKQAASGGPYTVTWPHAASPTYAAPTVLWAGGTAPTMTVAANAVDVYDLVTADGATWYGRATQNVS
jgi:hypothetical protein